MPQSWIWGSPMTMVSPSITRGMPEMSASLHGAPRIIRENVKP